MKFRNDEVDQVLWTATNDMACYNLPSQIVQHWTYVHELNGALVDVCKFLVSDFKVKQWPLNPMAPTFESNVNSDINMTNNIEKKQPVKRREGSNDWKTVSGQWKPKKQRSCSWDSSFSNRHQAFQDDDEIQKGNTKNAQGNDRSMQRKLEHNDVNIVKDGKIETLEEKHDVELVTNDTLMALFESMNDDHLKSQQESDKIIKSLQYDIVMKKKKLKDELDTVRGLNTQCKKQIKQSAKEKKENEIKCKEMKSKMTEIEAQMELFQDTLNHNEELERMSDQHWSRLK